jgi:hypothetical protein
MGLNDRRPLWFVQQSYLLVQLLPSSEALAIREDINTSIHGNRPVSTGKLQFAKNAEMVQNTALKALRAHTKTHREILK